MDAPSCQDLTAAEAIRAYMGAQDAGVWSAPVEEEDADWHNAYELSLSVVEKDVFERILVVSRPYGLTDFMHYGGSHVVLTQFSEAGAPRTSFGPKAALKINADIQRALGYDANATPTHLEGAYVDYTAQWQAPPGSDAVTREMFRYLSAKQEQAFSAPAPRESVRRKLEMDAEWSVRLNTPVREDLQYARKIFANGGIPALKAALGKGLLP